MNAVIETRELSKRYRRVTALSDCTITVPEARISALIGPNGAGKTTLLRILAGLAELRIALDRPVGKLSGGQRAQVALALTLAKRPRVLLLDEPVAALDPLARRNFLATLVTAVADAEGGLTVVLSSHLVADLERVCDHIIMLAASKVQLCGDIDTLLAEHKILVGPRKDTSALERTHTVVQAERTARQATLLVRLNGPAIDPAYQAEDVSLEDLVLAYMGAEVAPAQAHLTTVREEQ